jgi:hypothetical protein
MNNAKLAFETRFMKDGGIDRDDLKWLTWKLKVARMECYNQYLRGRTK